MHAASSQKCINPSTRVPQQSHSNPLPFSGRRRTFVLHGRKAGWNGGLGERKRWMAGSKGGIDQSVCHSLSGVAVTTVEMDFHEMGSSFPSPLELLLPFIPWTESFTYSVCIECNVKGDSLLRNTINRRLASNTASQPQCLKLPPPAPQKLLLTCITHQRSGAPRRLLLLWVIRETICSSAEVSVGHFPGKCLLFPVLVVLSCWLSTASMLRCRAIFSPIVNSLMVDCIWIRFLISISMKGITAARDGV